MSKKQIKYYKGQLIQFEYYDLVDFYDPILRKPTIEYNFNQPNAIANAEYISFSLAESLDKLGGLGLSANQVGLSHRVCVINMGTEIWTMFNPVILEKSDTKANFAEGCLSYPGLYLKLNRPDHIRVKFQAIGGQEVIKRFDGLTAVVIQHEIDHLDGNLFTEAVSPIKLDQAKKKVKKNIKKMIAYNRSQETAMSAQEDTTIIDPAPEPKITILEPKVEPKTPQMFSYSTD
jgi:peptide deformylase